MGQKISLKAKDGHALGGYKAEPSGKAKGGLVVIQEIFGVNQHVRNLCDQFAKAGYVAVAPALFDRVKKDVDLGYSEADLNAGRECRQKLTDDMIVNDVNAAIDEAKKGGKVGLVGYCFGGYVAWLAATQANGLAASICYYGGGIAPKKDFKPKVPVQLHFGDKDMAISLTDVGTVKAAHPQLPIYVYDDSGHGFCCDERASYNADACKRATSRTIAFLNQHVG
ncbi:MAG TPA: dienelactone hydrolase family protein [Alphaproteobacteria bacterium]